MSTQELRLAILHKVISELDDVGKTQLQKLCYFLQEAMGIPTKYSFRMHHYGPYSEALDTDMARLKLTGYINIEPDLEGFGFHITSKDDPLEEWSRLISSYLQLVDGVVRTFGKRPPHDLELAATIHFVNQLLPDVSTEEVLDRVKALKPRFNDSYVKTRHTELKQLGLLGCTDSS